MKRPLACDYRFEWKPQDLWIGAYWRKTQGDYCKRLDVWICLIPMLPFHYTLMYL